MLPSRTLAASTDRVERFVDERRLGELLGPSPAQHILHNHGVGDEDAVVQQLEPVGSAGMGGVGAAASACMLCR